MMRWLGMMAVTAGLALGACGSSEKKNESDPTFVEKSPDQAIIGRWSDGSNTVAFESGGAYRWEEARSCGSPPCPGTVSTGKWSYRNGNIYLDHSEGGDEIIGFSFMDQQTGVTLTSEKQSKSWILRRQ